MAALFLISFSFMFVNLIVSIQDLSRAILNISRTSQFEEALLSMCELALLWRLYLETYRVCKRELYSQ